MNAEDLLIKAQNLSCEFDISKPWLNRLLEGGDLMLSTAARWFSCCCWIIAFAVSAFCAAWFAKSSAWRA